jgi:hypothetical protein
MYEKEVDQKEWHITTKSFKKSFSIVRNNGIIERLDQSQLYPNLEVPGLT